MRPFKALSTRWLFASVCKQIEDAGIDLTEGALITIEQVRDERLTSRVKELADQRINAVFTSWNAVNAVLKAIDTAPNWKIFCMSGYTKHWIVENFSPEHVVATADSAAELAERIMENNVKEVVFFCGDQRRNELPDALKNGNIKVEELVVYKTIESPQEVGEYFDAVLFFSPSAVRSFFTANKLTDEVVCFTIGNTTAEEIKKYVNNRIVVAEKPTQDGVAAALINYYKQTVRL